MTADARVGFVMGQNISYAGPLNEDLDVPRATVIAAILVLQTSRSMAKWSLRGWLKGEQEGVGWIQPSSRSDAQAGVW